MTGDWYMTDISLIYHWYITDDSWLVTDDWYMTDIWLIYGRYMIDIWLMLMLMLIPSSNIRMVFSLSVGWRGGWAGAMGMRGGSTNAWSAEIAGQLKPAAFYIFSQFCQIKASFCHLNQLLAILATFGYCHELFVTLGNCWQLVPSSCHQIFFFICQSDSL